MMLLSGFTRAAYQSLPVPIHLPKSGSCCKCECLWWNKSVWFPVLYLHAPQFQCRIDSREWIPRIMSMRVECNFLQCCHQWATVDVPLQELPMKFNSANLLRILFGYLLLCLSYADSVSDVHCKLVIKTFDLGSFCLFLQNMLFLHWQKTHEQCPFAAVSFNLSIASAYEHLLIMPIYHLMQMPMYACGTNLQKHAPILCLLSVFLVAKSAVYAIFP